MNKFSYVHPPCTEPVVCLNVPMYNDPLQQQRQQSLGSKSFSQPRNLPSICEIVYFCIYVILLFCGISGNEVWAIKASRASCPSSIIACSSSTLPTTRVPSQIDCLKRCMTTAFAFINYFSAQQSCVKAWASQASKSVELAAVAESRTVPTLGPTTTQQLMFDSTNLTFA